MDEKKYFVTVNPGSIGGEKTDESFEFEIVATEEQVDRLQELFEDTSDAETSAPASRMFMPLNTDAAYDSQLIKVYRMLHELGTPETKARIEQMNVLNAPIAPA